MRRSLVVGLALLLVACTTKKLPTTSPAKKPVQADVVAGIATLTGKVKIISDNGGGIIGNNGGGIISDNGGGIISDNGGGIISNNSGSIVSNNGGGLTSKVKRTLLAAPTLVEYALADADVEFLDAAGQPALDEKGKPLTAHTDGTGSYKLNTKLPARNLVARVKLHDGGLLHGGELGAMCATGAKALEIDTSTSLGAAYVLGKFVGGSQATYDKLPGAEADQLHAELQDARRYLAGPPSYKGADLVAITEAIRGKVPAVDKRLDEIKALLLGQAKLGAGRQASSVAISGPSGLAVGPDGTIYLGENYFGRIRAVDPTGTLSNFADSVRGKVKANFPHLLGLALAPDGGLYVTSGANLYRAGPDGSHAIVAGEGAQALARGVVAASDGTVYYGEDCSDVKGATPRVFVIPPGGVPRALPIDDHWAEGAITNLALYPDGDLGLLFYRVAPGRTAFYRYHADGDRLTLVSEELSGAPDNDGLAIAKDGTAYIGEGNGGRVSAIGPDGTRRTVAGRGAPAGATDVAIPGDLALTPAGTLLIVDAGAALVRELTADGKLVTRIGTASAVQGGTFDSLALNAPIGAAFDAQNRLVVAEAGANRVTRFDGKALETLAGGSVGFTGDGGPAKAAQFSGPQFVAVDGGSIYVFDLYNHRLRKIDAAGTITSSLGSYTANEQFQPGERRAPDQVSPEGQGLCFGPDHTAYFSTRHGQILRQAADGMVEWVAGQLTTGSTPDLGSLVGGGTGLGGFISSGAPTPADKATLLYPKGMAFSPAGDLYVAEFAGLRVSKIAGGVVTPFAGLPQVEAIGAMSEPDRQEEGIQASKALVALPADVCFDAKGNMYLSEIGSTGISLFTALGSGGSPFGDSLPPVPPRVRKIAPDGTITTICGKGGKFFTDPDAEDGLVLPTGLAIAPDGRLAIVDTGANRIVILPAGSY